MTPEFRDHLAATLAEIESSGLLKSERPIESPQNARIKVQGRQMLNLCANNYLGLADHPDLVRAAQQALERDGYGMASVRFICGTNDVHRELETALAEFLEKDDAILFAACFDANGGLFEPLLGPEDAIISDVDYSGRDDGNTQEIDLYIVEAGDTLNTIAQKNKNSYL